MITFPSALIFLNEMKVSDIAYYDNIEIKIIFIQDAMVDQYLLNYFKLFKYILIDHNFLQKSLLHYFKSRYISLELLIFHRI